MLLLDGSAVSTHLRRSERPYLAYTEGRFPRIDRLAERILSELQLTGRASLETDRGKTTLTVTIDLSELEEEERGEDSTLGALIEELERYRVVLTEGRFVSASGFEIIEDGTLA